MYVCVLGFDTLALNTSDRNKPQSGAVGLPRLWEGRQVRLIMIIIKMIIMIMIMIMIIATIITSIAIIRQIITNLQSLLRAT